MLVELSVATPLHSQLKKKLNYVWTIFKNDLEQDQKLKNFQINRDLTFLVNINIYRSTFNKH